MLEYLYPYRLRPPHELEHVFSHKRMPLVTCRLHACGKFPNNILWQIRIFWGLANRTCRGALLSTLNQTSRAEISTYKIYISLVHNNLDNEENDENARFVLDLLIPKLVLVHIAHTCAHDADKNAPKI